MSANSWQKCWQCAWDHWKALQQVKGDIAANSRPQKRREFALCVSWTLIKNSEALFLLLPRVAIIQKSIQKIKANCGDKYPKAIPCKGHQRTVYWQNVESHCIFKGPVSKKYSKQVLPIGNQYNHMLVCAKLIKPAFFFLLVWASILPLFWNILLASVLSVVFFFFFFSFSVRPSVCPSRYFSIWLSSAKELKDKHNRPPFHLPPAEQICLRPV